MSRTRERGREPVEVIRENTKTFLNVTFGMIPDSLDQMLAGMHICMLHNYVYVWMNACMYA